MQADRWRRVRELVEEAVLRPAAERAAFLDESCAGDAELRREVEELFAADEGGAELEPPSARDVSGLSAPAPGEDLSGTRVGPYEITRRVASGGMGTVYRAVRADDQFSKQVAVKVIKRGMASDEILDRFRRERQVLANLEHPGIARLIDGGMTEDGRSYLVMEYVEGVPIDEYCDENRLSTRERSALFAEVCDAVQFAHGSLVVHRDLKPGNVLVTQDGRPKLLDFGIAKVLDPESSAGVELTRAAAQIMTPEFASPEQVRGRPVTTASHVYSLGVLLYQLLTGHSPYELDARSLSEIERVVCEEEPARPSTVITRSPRSETRGRTTRPKTAEDLSRLREATTQRLRRALVGDLDTIVLKALRKEPHRRYASAGQLADDLRRYLDGRPVSARPETVAYLATKFVRRNKALVAASAGVLLAIVAGLVTSYGQYLRANAGWREAAANEQLALTALGEARILAGDLEQQKQVAEENRRRAEDRLVEVQELAGRLEGQRAVAQRRFDEVRGFATSLVFDVFDSLQDVPGATYARSRVLELGLEHLDRIALDLPTGAGVDPAEERALLREVVEGYRRFGEVQGSLRERNLGRDAAAHESHRKSLALARELAELPGAGAVELVVLARACAAMGDFLQLSAGASVEGGELFDEAIAILEPLTADPDVGGSARRELAVAHTLRGRGLSRGGRPELAREHFERATGLRTELHAERPDVLNRGELALAEFDEGDVLRLLGDMPGALRTGERALERLRGTLADEPGNLSWKRGLLHAHTLLGRVYLSMAGREAALEHFETARDIATAMIEEDDRDLRARRDLVITYVYLGDLLKTMGDVDGALAAQRAQVELAGELAERDTAGRSARLDLARAQVQLADVERELGHVIEAAETIRSATETAEALLGEQTDDFDAAWIVWIACGTHGQVLLELAAADGVSPEYRRRQVTRAKQQFERGLEVLEGLELDGGYVEHRVKNSKRFREDIARCAERLAELGADQ